jgi:hypothetical protein
MRKILFVAAFCLLLGLPCRPQAQPSRVTVRAVLVDKDLNQKPVPHLGLQLVPETGDAGSPRETKTDFDGRAELQLPPGNYRLTTPQGVDNLTPSARSKRQCWPLTPTATLPSSTPT